MAAPLEFEARRKRQPGLNLVPLINVVFLLLIFFMLSSTLVTPDEFDVNLPESESGRAQGSVPVVVLIAGDGALAVNNLPVRLGGLAARLRDATDESGVSRVIVKADAAATTASVISVLRRARAAGIEQVALATQAAGGS
ncbi:MAG: biopolymer transporter ExbD [Alphaproteobacteria bacterium]|nr:biopolymer transporter ExbD [Alphaproteobacteria bacterium]